MRSEFMITRQGRQFVLYAGLLDMAHDNGLKSIHTELVQVPTPENGMVAICKATTYFDEVDDMSPTQEKRGKMFQGIGDASPESVGKMIVPHIIRMAETRAKARALRDALNIGATALEELGGEDTPPSPSEGVSEPLRAVRGQAGSGSTSSSEASDKQKAEIRRRLDLLNIDEAQLSKIYNIRIDTMSKAEAKWTFDWLKVEKEKREGAG